jgi:hypothetical protein
MFLASAWANFSSVKLVTSKHAAPLAPSRACYTQSQILHVLIDKDSQSAIDGRKVRSNQRCMLSDVSKRSHFLQKSNMPRPGSELEAATLSLVLFEFKFYR